MVIFDKNIGYIGHLIRLSYEAQQTDHEQR